MAIWGGRSVEPENWHIDNLLKSDKADKSIHTY